MGPEWKITTVAHWWNFVPALPHRPTRGRGYPSPYWSLLYQSSLKLNQAKEITIVASWIIIDLYQTITQACIVSDAIDVLPTWVLFYDIILLILIVENDVSTRIEISIMNINEKLWIDNCVRANIINLIFFHKCLTPFMINAFSDLDSIKFPHWRDQANGAFLVPSLTTGSSPTLFLFHLYRKDIITHVCLIKPFTETFHRLLSIARLSEYQQYGITIFLLHIFRINMWFLLDVWENNGVLFYRTSILDTKVALRGFCLADWEQKMKSIYRTYLLNVQWFFDKHIDT